MLRNAPRSTVITSDYVNDVEMNFDTIILDNLALRDSRMTFLASNYETLEKTLYIIGPVDDNIRAAARFFLYSGTPFDDGVVILYDMATLSFRDVNFS